MRVRMLRTIEIPDGDRHTRLEKGSLINVSKAQAEELTAGAEPAAKLELDTPAGTVSCSASIESTTPDSVVVKVTASVPSQVSPDEKPGVRLESAVGAVVLEKPAERKHAPSGSRWMFARPAGSGGVAAFSAHCTGYAPSGEAIVEIPALGVDLEPSTAPRRSSKSAASEA
jgi:hypothetical protein